MSSAALFLSAMKAAKGIQLLRKMAIEGANSSVYRDIAEDEWLCDMRADGCHRVIFASPRLFHYTELDIPRDVRRLEIFSLTPSKIAIDWEDARFNHLRYIASDGIMVRADSLLASPFLMCANISVTETEKINFDLDGHIEY